MILKTAVVWKFRSIENSGTVRFEPDVTCLVGKNESGKTAFLEALYQANPLGGPGRGFDELRDYPRRLRGRERAQIAATTPSRPPSSSATPTWRRSPSGSGPTPSVPRS